MEQTKLPSANALEQAKLPSANALEQTKLACAMNAYIETLESELSDRDDKEVVIQENYKCLVTLLLNQHSAVNYDSDGVTSLKKLNDILKILNLL